MKRLNTKNFQEFQEWTESKTYRRIYYLSIIIFIFSIIFNWDKINLLRLIAYIWLPLLILYIASRLFNWAVNDLQEEQKEKI